MARRRPEARPDEILDAALSAFVEFGFSGARIEEIATRAGVSKGAVYLYFDSKESMLKALVHRLADRVVGGAEALVRTNSDADAAQTLRALLTFMATQLSNPAVSAAPRLVLAEAQRFPEIAALYRDEVIARGMQLIAKLCQRGVAQGIFREIEPPVLLRVCAGPLLAHMLLSTVFADRSKPGIAPDVLAREIADVVLNGVKTRSAA